jgi:hypothetical protein
VIGAAAIIACSESSNASDRLCTPGAYVFCRCKDRNEGTKLCQPNGKDFGACDCGEPGKPPPLTPSGDSRFVPVDTPGAPSDGGVPIDDRCAGKLAVIASSDSDLFLYAAAYKGKGEWVVGKSEGPALRSAPAGALVNGALVAVWRSRYDLIAWTKFEAGQTALSPPFSVGFAITSQPPALVGKDASARLFYRAGEDVHNEGTYTPAKGWDTADTTVPSQPKIVGKSAPAAITMVAGDVIAFSGEDGTIATQSFTSGKWSDATKIEGAQGLPHEAPSLVALAGAADDALIVYQGTDLLLHWSTRETSTQKWAAPALVDTTTPSEGGPRLAAMANGRAMLVWKSVSGAPWYSVFDAAKTPRWSSPAPLLPQENISVIHAPTVVSGRCGSDATAGFVSSDGTVRVALFRDGAWTSYPVPGMTKMTFAGAGEVP